MSKMIQMKLKRLATTSEVYIGCLAHTVRRIA